MSESAASVFLVNLTDGFLYRLSGNPSNGQVLSFDTNNNLLVGTNAGAGDVLAANNLSDLGDIPTARTNLGLGTLATQNGTFSGTHSGNTSGTNTGDQTNIIGNAATATALQTPRTINGVAFDGTANIVVTAAGSTLSDAVTINRGGTGQTAVGTALYGLRTNAGATGTEWAPMVTGDLGNTDNRLLRADGTGGLTAQGSPITVADSGLMTFTLVTGTDFLMFYSSAGQLRGDITVDGSTNALWRIRNASQGVAINMAANAGTTSYINAGNVAIGATTASEKLHVTGNIRLTGYHVIPEVAAPATPASGLMHVYAKTDNHLYAKNDLGTEYKITGSGGGDALTTNGLGQFAATASADLAGVITDETGTGALVFANSCTLVTPTLGVATATSINKVSITAPTTSATLAIADGATLTCSASATISGTNTGDQDLSSYATIAYADSLVVGLLDDRGNYDASSNLFPSTGGSGSGGAILKGDLWTVSVAGTLGGTAVTAGDIVRALVNTPGQTASNWAVSETNIGYTPLNASLTDGMIYVGNGSNIGTAVTPSGDVTISNAGVTAIGAAKVTNTMLAGSIAASKLIGTDITTVGTVTTGTWSTGAVIGTATMTLGSDATGDIYHRHSDGTLKRLAIGSAGAVLSPVAGVPAWHTGAVTVSGVAPVDASGTDVAGTAETIAGGKGTGAGAAGNVIIQTSTPGGSGSSPQSLTTRITVSDTEITKTLPVVLPASTTSRAPLRSPHGSAPSSPVDGDEWTTTAGKFARINGVTHKIGGESRTVTVVFDGAGSVLTTGVKAYVPIPYDCTIEDWTIVSSVSGSIVVDVWKDTYANFPPTVADTITNSDKPTLASAQKNQNLTLSAWTTTTLTKGDWLAFNIDSVTTCTRVVLSIRVRLRA